MNKTILRKIKFNDIEKMKKLDKEIKEEYTKMMVSIYKETNERKKLEAIQEEISKTEIDPNLTIGKRKMFFGRIGVGKTTVAKKISQDEGVDFVDCDKEIWKHYKGNINKVKSDIKESIESKNKEKYKNILRKFSKDVNWHEMFSKNANYEVSVLGNFYNIDAIPKEIVKQFKIFKIMCYIETRQMNIKYRGLKQDWVNKLDFMYEDPKDLIYGTIFTEDVLGNTGK